jgi:hypothetical protein
MHLQKRGMMPPADGGAPGGLPDSYFLTANKKGLPQRERPLKYSGMNP